MQRLPVQTPSIAESVASARRCNLPWPLHTRPIQASSVQGTLKTGLRSHDAVQVVGLEWELGKLTSAVSTRACLARSELRPDRITSRKFDARDELNQLPSHPFG